MKVSTPEFAVPAPRHQIHLAPVQAKSMVNARLLGSSMHMLPTTYIKSCIYAWRQNWQVSCIIELQVSCGNRCQPQSQSWGAIDVIFQVSHAVRGMPRVSQAIMHFETLLLDQHFRSSFPHMHVECPLAVLHPVQPVCRGYTLPSMFEKMCSKIYLQQSTRAETQCNCMWSCHSTDAIPSENLNMQALPMSAAHTWLAHVIGYMCAAFDDNTLPNFETMK